MARTTKADIMLKDARDRLWVVKEERDTAQRQLDQAQARYEAHQEAFEALEHALKRPPKKSFTYAPPVAAKSSPKGKGTKSIARTEEPTANALFASNAAEGD